jgi:hypothetical protein
MKSIRLVLGALIFIGMFTSISLAGTAGRTFVSSLGADTNPCSLAAPCRTFAQAISQTASGGEVVVLNSAGYGPFTISQSVAITAPEGIYAGISQGSDSGDGIDISAGPTDVVTLKGLTIIGPGASASTGNGVFFETGATLHLEGCEVRGFNVDVLVTVNSQLSIKDTVVKDANFGIALLGNTAGTMSASMDNVTVNNNGNVGIEVQSIATGSVIQAAIRESQISGNGFGIVAISPAGTGDGSGLRPDIDFTTTAGIDIESCVIANGGTAIATEGESVLSLSNCLISHNGAGFDIEGGFIESRVNNTFNGNGANTGALTTLAAQ